MPLPPAIRSAIPLIIGLSVGAIGATMFLESMPGSEGSPQERANKLEIELKHAQNRIAALEAANKKETEEQARGVLGRLTEASHADSKRRLADGARRIAEDIREGRPVTPEDIFRATQPLRRDLAPLFDRMRVKQQQKMVDSMTGELARRYNLPPASQQVLKKWFEKRAEEEANRWNDLMTQDGTRLQDIIRASQDVRADEGLDQIMPSILTGDKLETFKKERMAERLQRVESESDMMVQRIDGIAHLDEAQRDQVFGIVARSSREYDPTMVVQGVQGDVGQTPTGNRQQAILSVLRPEQRTAFEAERQRRRDEAAKDMESIGLALPADWDFFESDFFR